MANLLVSIERFEEAVRAHEMRGGGDPAYIPEIEKEYESAKRSLWNAVFLHVGASHAIKDMGAKIVQEIIEDD